jgi:hypothetical protein
MTQNPKIPRQNPKLTNNESNCLTYSTKMMKRLIHLFIKPSYEKKIVDFFPTKQIGKFLEKFVFS